MMGPASGETPVNAIRPGTLANLSHFLGETVRYVVTTDSGCGLLARMPASRARLDLQSLRLGRRLRAMRGLDDRGGG